MTKPGRPKLPDSEKSDWIKLGTKVSPEANEKLKSLKKRGYMKAKVVNKAIIKYNPEDDE